MITNSKGKYLPFKVRTTWETINSLDEIEKKIYHYLVKIGDVEIVDNLQSSESSSLKDNSLQEVPA